MGSLSTRFLELKHLRLLKEEAFLVQLEEALRIMDEHEHADSVRGEINRIRKRRMKLKEVIDRADSCR